MVAAIVDKRNNCETNRQDFKWNDDEKLQDKEQELDELKHTHTQTHDEH